MTRQEFKAFRTQNGWNQTEFAEKIGYSNQATISKKEQGVLPVSRQDELIIEALKRGYLEEINMK